MQQRKTDVMIDLETMGTSAHAVIISVGAVAFGPQEQELGATFYQVVERAPQLQLHREWDQGTWEWWQKQSAEARAVLEEPGVHPAKVLRNLRDFIDCFTPGERDVRVWGNGSDFDLSILGSLHRELLVQTPWRFYNHRCFRTLKEVFKPQYVAAQTAIPRTEAHNALGDAKWQARIAQYIYRTQGLGVFGG